MPANIIEAKKHAMRQSAEGSWYLTIALAQEDTPLWLFTAPVGQRMALAELTILADEQPAPPDPAKAAGGYARAAALSPERRSEIASEAAKTRWEGEKPKRKWSDMKWVERFGILCDKPQFQDFMWKFAGIGHSDLVGEDAPEPSEVAAILVREYCGVLSRKEIDDHPTAAQRAAALMTEWDAHRGRTGRP